MRHVQRTLVAMKDFEDSLHDGTLRIDGEIMRSECFPPRSREDHANYGQHHYTTPNTSLRKSM